MATTKSTKAKPDLYSLLVGINSYQNYPLKGCLNDVSRMKQYLGNTFVKAEFDQIHIKELTEDDASKKNIVDAFKKHLGKAKKGDSVLIYFSGHGVREETEYMIFQDEEVDSNIGGLLCAGFINEKQANLHDYILSNKEVRYLLRPLAMDSKDKVKSHVLTIFDCCHSGSSTRSVGSTDLPETSRQISRNPLPGRKLNDFVFSSDKKLVSALKKASKPLDEIMPQGDHVMIAACREVELAWESRNENNERHGAFSTALINVLEQHKGRISYQELYSRVLNRMKFSMSRKEGNKGQTPQVYIRTDNLNDRYNVFLSNKPNEQPSYGSVEKSGDEWRIDMGVFHGLPINPKKETVKVKVYEPGKKRKAVEGTISEVFPFHSIIKFPPRREPAAGKSYQGELDGLGISPLNVFVKGEKKIKDATFKILSKKLKEFKGQLFKMVHTERDADYVVRAEKGIFLITRNSEKDRPLVKPTDYLDRQNKFNPNSVDEIYNNLQQIGKWEFIKSLNHSTTPVPSSLKSKATMYPVEFKLYRVDEKTGKEKQLSHKDGRFLVDMKKGEKNIWMRFEVVNHSSQILNCSLAIMTGDFAFLVTDHANGMKAPVVMLQESTDSEKGFIAKSMGMAPPGLEEKVKESYVPLEINQYYKDFNVEGESTFFKLIVSTKPLDTIDTFHMKGLEYPKKEDVSSRTFSFNKVTKPSLPQVEWDVRTIEMYVSNPDYKAPK